MVQTTGSAQLGFAIDGGTPAALVFHEEHWADASEENLALHESACSATVATVDGGGSHDIEVYQRHVNVADTTTASASDIWILIIKIA